MTSVRRVCCSVAAIGLLLALASCGRPAECDASASCKAGPRAETAAICAVRTFEIPKPPTYPIAVATYPTAPSVEMGTATPQPSPSPEPPPSETPTVTPTRMPPPPEEIGTYAPPTSNFTPRPRPTYPSSSDITLGNDGCYQAFVDSCKWTESQRYEWSGRLLVQLTSPCDADILLVFYPDTGDVEFLSHH